ncbi:MAG: amidohydrolase family protein, partial [Rectinema sp.]|nr:amidohydrolase family protein [Rectinema sp.]
EAPVVHLQHAYVIPSLVEIHIHGCGSWGFEQADSADLRAARDFLETRAIGCFVPTTLWDEGVIPHLVDAIRHSSLPLWVLPGLYIEGPFVNPARRGGIPETHIRTPDVFYVRKILELTQGLLKLITIAPELPGVTDIYSIFAEAGVMVALGHSDARVGEATLPRAPFSMTHLFNAMRGIDHREGGLANLAFSGLPAFVEVNGDGIHLNRTCLRLAARALDLDQLVLISDAVIGAGIPYGHFSYYGRDIVSSPRGVRYADTDVLMGSNRLGIEIVRLFATEAQVPLWQAIRAMSLVPRRLLGQDRDFGSIKTGKVADLFICDRDLEQPIRPETILAEETPA